MRAGLEEESLRLSKGEANQVIDLWLRERLAGPTQPQTLTSPPSVSELARILNTSEQEVASLLFKIRNPNGRKPRRAIPVPRSWAIIALIYASAALGLVMFRQYTAASARAYVSGPYYDYTGSYSGQTSPAHLYSRSSARAGMQREIGFQYRGQSSPSYSFNSRKPIDWALAQKDLLGQIEKINQEEPVNLVDDITPQMISESLAQGSHEVGSNVYDPAAPQESTGNRPLVRWNAFRLEVGDRAISTVMPAATVANEALEKAVHENIKSRLTRLVKAMQARLAPPEDADVKS